jgi:DNA-directed RNA polymerase subunit F
MTIEELKKLLNKSNEEINLTENELKEALDFLNVLAKLSINHLKKIAHDKKCDSIR